MSLQVHDLKISFLDGRQHLESWLHRVFESVLSNNFKWRATIELWNKKHHEFEIFLLLPFPQYLIHYS